MAHPASYQAGAAQAMALRGAGILAFSQGDYDAARRLCQESLEVAEAWVTVRGLPWRSVSWAAWR